MKNTLFWIFGGLASASLSAIIFVMFYSLGRIYGNRVIGLDSQIVLSVAFPLFFLIVLYMLFTKK